MPGRPRTTGEEIGTPLRLRPTLDPKPWGGHRLTRYGKHLPVEPIGESLESGDDALVEGGRFDGVALGALARQMPRSLLGSRGAAAAGAGGGFPLLVKLIDAQQDLSIQVHPPDALAPPGKRGKTEAWLILDSTEAGSLVTGVSGPIDPANIGERIVRERVRAGDVFFVPAGTVHAIGAGVLLYEVQQASDVTYRLYDWGRPRELHLDRGLEAADPASRAWRVEPLRFDAQREALVACRHFLLERWTLEGTSTFAADGATCRVLTVVDGSLTVAGQEIDVGTSVVLPADLPEVELTGRAIVLAASIPDLQSDVVEPLRRAGYDDAAIHNLGIDVS